MLYMQKECLPPVLAMTFKDNLHTRFSDHGKPNVVVINRVPGAPPSWVSTNLGGHGEYG